MNRVVFIFLSILLIVFPLTIENLENENVNYFDLVKNITTELIHTVVKAQVKNPEEINFTNDQVALLKIKLDELEVTDLEFENNFSFATEFKATPPARQIFLFLVIL